MQGTKNGTQPGLHGGFLSFVELSLDVAEEMNGEVYTCQASNNQMQRSVHDATTLNVLCKCARASINGKINGTSAYYLFANEYFISDAPVRISIHIVQHSAYDTLGKKAGNIS